MPGAHSKGRTRRSAGSTSVGYLPPLDGVRALAVLAVMAYHGGVSFGTGGFLGVDAFFVLSGFLITSLLVAEWRRTGSISLGAFWSRRARRLLPALFLLLAGIAAYAAFVAPPDTRSTLRGDALSTLFYFANWHAIFANQGYFAQAALPSPLLHTWSLAIEEQFYILWPLLVLALLRWRRSVRPVLVVAVLGAAASALAMAALYHPGADPARVYYGTDTRAQALLVGAALAVVLAGRRPAEGRLARGALSSLALVGAGAVAWGWASLTGASTGLYRGGFALDGLAVAAVICCSVQVPRGLVAKALSPAPLRYIGRISYGLYLWHWPVFIYLDHARTGLLGWELLGARVGLSFAIAIVSYHLVERPIRTGALVRAWRAWALTPAAIGATALAVVAATTAAVPEALAATVTPTAAHRPPAASAPVPPVQVALFGDSVAMTLGMGLYVREKPYGVHIESEAQLGCGLAVGGPFYDSGKVSYRPTCDSWPSQWAAEMAQLRPDVAAVLVGPWDTVNRLHDGRVEHLGQPDFDTYERGQIERAVQVLHAGGAQVVFFTSPYYDHGEQPDGSPWPQDDHARVDELNALIGQVAAQSPGVVSVVPVGAMMSPGGGFSRTVDGVTARTSDGIHVTYAGGEVLAPKVLPALAAAGERARRASAAATPASRPAPGRG